MNISVSVMAHHKRSVAAKALYKKLINYPFSDVFLIWDELNNEWHTGKRSLEVGMVLGSDWHIVIQDDAVLTPYFYDNIERIIATVPTKTIVSLYTGKVKPLADRVFQAVDKAEEGSWLNFYMLLWGVGILIPSDHIEPMLDFISGDRYNDTPYDTRIGIFYQRNRLPIYYCVPSLVDHNDHLGSLLAHGGTVAPRIAHRLATGPIAWNNQIIDI